MIITGEHSGREYPTRPIVGVGAVIVVPDGERASLGLGGQVRLPGVVLVRRAHEPLAGEWSLPGGAVDVGETLAAAVAREAAEESGLSVEAGPVIEVFDRIMLDPSRRVRYHFVLIDYLCRPVGGRLAAGSDASDVAIAHPDDIAAFGLTAKADEVVRRGFELAGVTRPSVQRP